MARKAKPIAAQTASVLGIDQSDTVTKSEGQAALERAATELAASRALQSKYSAKLLSMTQRQQRMADMLIQYADPKSAIYSSPLPSIFAQWLLIDLGYLLPPDKAYAKITTQSQSQSQSQPQSQEAPSTIIADDPLDDDTDTDADTSELQEEL